MSANDTYFIAAIAPIGVAESPDSNARAERSVEKRIEETYSELCPSLVRFLRAKTGSLEEAKDIAQETFGKLLELERLDEVKSLTGFVWKTAQNIVIDRQRQRANRSRLDPVALFEPVQQTRSPEFWLDAKQRVDILERAIDLLPAMCRSVFVLRVLKERSSPEVAQELGISERLVRQYVARGIEHCAEHLDEAEAHRGKSK
jgi:RNA polymerase sigma factor (sigma-70 family)